MHALVAASGVVQDRCALSLPDGSKLDEAAMGRVRRALDGDLRVRTLRGRR